MLMSVIVFVDRLVGFSLKLVFPHEPVLGDQLTSGL